VMSRRRWLLPALVVVALAAPATASASAPSLQVSVTNGGCGPAGAPTRCTLDVIFNEIPGAARYTAAVASPDGSVVDYGAIGAGSGSVLVPYVGNGTYTVTVSAWAASQRESIPQALASGG
jgi:hypothetical protein